MSHPGHQIEVLNNELCELQEQMLMAPKGERRQYKKDIQALDERIAKLSYAQQAAAADLVTSAEAAEACIGHTHEGMTPLEK